MGFGSYDESEQEQPKAEEKDIGEDATSEVRGKNSDHDGEDKIAESSTEDMMKHL